LEIDSGPDITMLTEHVAPEGFDTGERKVIYLPTDGGGYLPKEASEALGWR
jgi:hypothetical protein